MTAQKRAEMAAKLLQSSLPNDAPPPPSPNVRAASIEALHDAIAARRRRIVRNRALAIASVFVLAATVAFFVSRVRSQDPAVAKKMNAVRATSNVVAHVVSGDAQIQRKNAVPAALRDGETIDEGSTVTTIASGRAVLDYIDGTRVALAGNAELSVDENGAHRVYSLEKGAVDLRVTKLTADQRLLVRTHDAEVEVRGTQFRVEIADPRTICDQGLTRVVVSEGVVVVRRNGKEARVEAGETFPSCAVEVASLPEARPSAVAPSTPRPRSNAAPSPSSTLEEQNNLFADAIEKKRNGDWTGATRAFEKLLTEYPNGALAENAAVERFKLLQKIDPASAKKAADEYLGRWPSGFARDDAKAIAERREK